MAARSGRGPAKRPARPDSVCASCGADVWHAWSLAGHCWVALAPRRYPLEGDYGTYEVWLDAHGGLLCMSLAAGARPDQPGAWRGLHHNAACGSWRVEVTTALAREARDALPVMTDDELLALGAQLRDVGQAISRELTSRALSASAE